MKHRLLAALVLVLMPVLVTADTMTAGKTVWSAQYQKEDVIRITMGISAETGADLIEIWVDATKLYQHYPLNSVGYNGSLYLASIREIRPGQAAGDACKNVGMRDPSTLFRAPKIVYSAMLEQPGGAYAFVEVRELGENYLIVVTKIIPRQREASKPPVDM